MSARRSKAEPRAYVSRDQAARAAAASTPTPRPGVLRTIDVHLSALAPGCDGLPLASDGRWRTLWWKTPKTALRIVLAFLDRRPEQVRLRAIGRPACVEIHDGEPEGAPRLLALIFDAPAAAVQAAHAALLNPERSAA